MRVIPLSDRDTVNRTRSLLEGKRIEKKNLFKIQSEEEGEKGEKEKKITMQMCHFPCQTPQDFHAIAMLSLANYATIFKTVLFYHWLFLMPF